MRYILTSQFKEKYIYNIYPCYQYQIDEFCKREDRERFRLVAGHFRFGIHKCHRGQWKYITMLRDPVQQVLSHYNHLAHSNEPLHKEIVKEYPSITAFTKHEWAKHFYISRLTGVSIKEIDKSPHKYYELAKENLIEHFAWVGITEYFQESLGMLQNRFGWKDLSTQHINVAQKKKFTLNNITEPELKSVQEAVYYDNKIYKSAKALFHECLILQDNKTGHKS